ncbi:MAG: hypothetical protein ABW019_13055 [Chitinophagaceae bacterium]
MTIVTEAGRKPCRNIIEMETPGTKPLDHREPARGKQQAAAGERFGEPACFAGIDSLKINPVMMKYANFNLTKF